MHPHYHIVATLWSPASYSLDSEQRYQGMDRAGFVYRGPDPFPEAALAIYQAERQLSAGAFDNGEQAAIALQRQIEQFSGERYSLIALYHQPSEAWRFAGYDVGEQTPRRWSALAHAYAFLTAEQWQSWKPLLNIDGLFDDRQHAEQFLELYLASDDPDMDGADLYAVVPVYLYQP